MPSAAVPTVTTEPIEVGDGSVAAYVAEPVEVSRGFWQLERQALKKLEDDIESAL